MKWRGSKFLTAAWAMMLVPALMSGCRDEGDVETNTFGEPDAVGLNEPEVEEVDVDIVAPDAGDEQIAEREPRRRPPQAEATGKIAMGADSLAFPTGVPQGSFLLVNANAPNEARMGQPYEYEIEVSNISENLVLDDVRLWQQVSAGLEVQDLQPAFRMAQRGDQPMDARRQQQRQQRQARTNQPGDEARQGARQGQAQGQDQMTRDQQQGDQGGMEHRTSGSSRQQQAPDRRVVWNVGTLQPGQSETIKVTAVGREEGALAACMGVDYKPVLCLATQFTKPDIDLVKMAPEVIGICEPLIYQYAIRNTGSGRTEAITIRDELPEGLTTAQGEQVVMLKVDPLAPEQTQEFEVPVKATRAGDFGSRAGAEGAGGLTAQSREPITSVQVARLDLQVDGPNVRTIDETLIYEVTVTNTGKVPARETTVHANMGDPIVVELASLEGEPEGDALMWALGDLDPGESRSFWIRATGREAAEFENIFVANAKCAGDYAPVRQVVQTEILSLPALHLVTIDNRDPVQSGENFEYVVQVVNEGTAPDRNVQVTATLPQGPELIEAGGTTDVQEQQQGQIVFNPIDTLEVGEEARWTVMVRATDAGPVRFKTSLTSDMLGQPVVAEEPTRLFNGGQDFQGAGEQSRAPRGQDARGQGQMRPGQSEQDARANSGQR